MSSVERRAAIQQWRHLLSAVAELHQLGYERARIVPFIVDTARSGKCGTGGVDPAHPAHPGFAAASR